MLTDTHTHLYVDEFRDAHTDAVDRAVAAGVTRMVMPNIDVASIGLLRDLMQTYSGTVYGAMGLHPTELGDDYRASLDAVLSELRTHAGDYVAVGEIGIDLYWDKSRLKEQREVFAAQVEAAVALDKPVIIHCREGFDDTLDILREASGTPRGVFHSFDGDTSRVDAVRAVGDFYFGINGIVTFKNSRLRDVLPYIGLDRILLETDSPYLAPVPHRGKRNESAFLPHIAAYVADIFGCDKEHVAEVTSKSADALFGLTQQTKTI